MLISPFEISWGCLQVRNKRRVSFFPSSVKLLGLPLEYPSIHSATHYPALHPFLDTPEAATREIYGNYVHVERQSGESADKK